MAATFWHFAMAKDIWQKRFPGQKPDNYLFPAFLAGSIGPDIGFYPGGQKNLPLFCHSSQAFELAANFLAQATDHPIKQEFALGWYLHLISDIYVHRLINVLCGLILFGKRNHALPVEDAVLAHHSLEWGIDCLLLKRNLAEMPDCINQIANYVEQISPSLLAEGLDRVGGSIHFKPSSWKKAVKNYIKLTRLFPILWDISGKLTGGGIFRKLVHRGLIWPTAQLLDLLGDYPSAGVLNPWPVPAYYLSAIQKVWAEMETFYLNNQADNFNHLKGVDYYNVDAGYFNLV